MSRITCRYKDKENAPERRNPCSISVEAKLSQPAVRGYRQLNGRIGYGYLDFTGFGLGGWRQSDLHPAISGRLEYSTMSVLPSFNNIWAQVILRGDPPEIVTQGILVEYSYSE
jgi:hypothetical protein